MARKPRPRKRCKQSRARRLVIKNKLERKLIDTQVRSGSALNNKDESSESIFNRLLEEQRTYPKHPAVVGHENEKREHEEEQIMDYSDSEDPDFELPDLLVEPSNETEELSVTGRRVVDINHVLTQLQKISNHHRECTMGKYKFNREVVSGLFSKYIYYCDNCESEVAVTSEPEDRKQEVNDAVVWGALSIGIGHSQTQELLGVMNVPMMSPKKFKMHEKRVGKVWEETLLKKMKENAEEERRIAIEKNNFLNGVPYITVIGDGGWAKRSYGHGMNSSSGVAVIIGAQTKKLLYIGVRNKFCYVCTKNKNKGTEPPAHECFLNYHGPSTGMESDIIVEGFKRSEEDYGLVYKFYIGDGDSSVFAHIQERCRYGRYVKKIECANHVTRALSDQLHKLAGNTSFPIESRRLLTSTADGDTISRLERIVKGVRTAIKECGTTKNNTDVINLRHDIKNSVDHVFGKHGKCRGDFCKRKDEQSVTDLVDNQFLTELRKAVGRVEAKAESLVFNQTSNKAEQYMSLVAKFTGGKRLNLSSRGSYRLRCFGAALSHTSGPSWHLSPFRKLTKNSPGRVTKSHFLSREKRRFKRCLQYSTSKSAPRKKFRKGGAYDSEYGPLAVEPDIDEDTLEERKKDILERLATDNREETERQTVGQHSNISWQEKRMNRLTASKFGVVAKRLAHTSCHNLVKDILYPRDLRTEAIIFGRVHEETAIKEYEAVTNNVVVKCGLFIDPNHPYLGASPDGLVGEKGLVEVKCLPSVKDNTLENHIQNNKKPGFCLEISENEVHLKKTHTYFYQIQGQLHIANKEWCDFIVYTSGAPLFIERINRDEEFWATKIYPKVTQFYLECILPEIADSRVTRGLRVRDPPYIMEAKEEKEKKEAKKKTVKKTEGETPSFTLGKEKKQAKKNAKKKTDGEGKNYSTNNVC